MVGAVNAVTIYTGVSTNTNGIANGMLNLDATTALGSANVELRGSGASVIPIPK